MIFVTVGTDSPFDRLVRVVDEWAAFTGRTDIFAQIGVGGWRPRHIPCTELLPPAEFKERFAAAEVIIAHAGMGTILNALHAGKPILVMPKRASLGEQRNEHQMATAHHLHSAQRIHAAFTEDELRFKLENLDELRPVETIPPFASPTLISGLRRYIFGPEAPTAGAEAARRRPLSPEAA